VSEELYYAEMEAARNSAADAYFAARPSLKDFAAITAFKAGFERAFAMMWARTLAVEAATVETGAKDE
jgi:hypothetical protein